MEKKKPNNNVYPLEEALKKRKEALERNKVYGYELKKDDQDIFNSLKRVAERKEKYKNKEDKILSGYLEDDLSNVEAINPKSQKKLNKIKKLNIEQEKEYNQQRLKNLQESQEFIDRQVKAYEDELYKRGYGRIKSNDTDNPLKYIMKHKTTGQILRGIAPILPLSGVAKGLYSDDITDAVLQGASVVDPTGITDSINEIKRAKDTLDTQDADEIKALEKEYFINALPLELKDQGDILFEEQQEKLKQRKK
jgi:hypothetical protein